MADSILINNFSVGWVPSDDEISGRKNGLLDMTNLELDRNGALTLTGGTRRVRSGLSANAHTIYSTIFSGQQSNFYALNDGNVYQDGNLIGSGGSSIRAAFSNAGGYTLACSGNTRLKISATQINNLGIKPATNPIAISSFYYDSPSSAIPVNATMILPGGAAATFAGNYLQMGSDPTTGVYISQSYGLGTFTYNWAKTANLANATKDDYLYISGNSFYPDTDVLQFDILLEVSNSNGDQVNNYFTITPSPADYHFDETGGNFRVKLRRGDFQKIGPSNLSWESVHGVRVTYTTQRLGSGPAFFTGDPAAYTIYFVGGSFAQKGTYEYAQINVNNNGQYLAMSEIGPKSDLIVSDMQSAIISFQNPSAIDSQINEVWIYRRSVDGLGLLNQWYRVGIIKQVDFGSLYKDVLDDTDALILNLRVNLNYKSVLSTSITDPILDIVGPINGRWYYFTNQYMYPSAISNPDLVDVSEGVKFSSSSDEIFMWARKLSEGVVIVMTSLDAYLITGTFQTLPDLSVDIYDRSLSCKYPAISSDVAIYAGNAFYLANDGWRSIDASGANPSLVSPNTDRLYRGITCGNFFGVANGQVQGFTKFPVIVAQNKLWCFLNNYNRAEVWDFHRQYWRVVQFPYNVTAAFVAQDGSILAGFSDNVVRALDYQISKKFDTSNQQVTFQTLVLDNGAPRKRKDSYTFKIRIGFSGDPLSVFIKIDTGETFKIADLQPTGYVKDYFIGLKDFFDKTKTFQVIITGTVNELVLNDIQIYFDTYPEQLSFLRALPENFTTTGLKRVFTVPFTIDTLGNNVTIKPIVDDIVQPPLVIKSNRKKSFQYNFPIVAGTQDIVKGVDYQFDISSTGLFEWFGFGQSKHIELLPEPILSYVIPVTNFGSPNKKRIRVWPVTINTRGQDVKFTPIVDGVKDPTNSVIFNTNDYLTKRQYFTTDVFGIDYSGIFEASSPFELVQVGNPDIVQVLPIARRFDQLGPEDLFKFGKLTGFVLRLLALGKTFGATDILPYRIFMQDCDILTGELYVVHGEENSYEIKLPQNTSGKILRIELGPTDYDFHRFYINVKVMKLGAETELTWVSLPAQA